MDEPLKARLIGASVLVLLAVALVPEMLSGPQRQAAGSAATTGSKATRTYTIDLGGAVAGGARLEPPSVETSTGPATTALPKVDAPAPRPAADEPPVPGELPGAVTMDAPEAAPAVGSPDTTVRASTPAQAASESEPATVTKPVPAPARGGYAVQVGAFGSAATARKLVSDLQGSGLPAYVAPLTKSGKTLHRVRVGPVADRAAADQMAARLKARGLPVAVVSDG